MGVRLAVCSKEKVQGVAAWLWMTCRQLNIMSGVSPAATGPYGEQPTPCQELALQDLAERGPTALRQRLDKRAAALQSTRC